MVYSPVFSGSVKLKRMISAAGLSGCRLEQSVLFDIKARWHFILFGMIFTVAQVGDHIVGRNMVFACFLSCIDTRNETGIQKVLCVLLVDAGNTVELVFRHSVGVFFENFYSTLTVSSCSSILCCFDLAASEATYCVDGFWLPESLSPVLSNGRKISPNSLQMTDFFCVLESGFKSAWSLVILDFDEILSVNSMVRIFWQSGLITSIFHQVP